MHYAVHLSAPATGGAQCEIPSGTSFVIRQRRGSNSFYAKLVEDSPDLFQKMRNQAIIDNSDIFQIEERIVGFSVYVTEEDLEALQIRFLCPENKEDALKMLKTI